MTNITLNKKWSHLLDSISAYKLFKNSLKNSRIKPVLSPVCTLAFAIGKFYKEPINEGFHVAIAGAGMIDANNKGDAYRLLSKLLGVNSIKVDLVGNDVHKDALYAPEVCLKTSVGEEVDVSTFEMTLGKYIETNKPDLIMLNHPGFESHYEQWFGEGEISACFDLGIMILGVSYGNDEAEFDDYYLKAHGYKVSEPLKNPFMLDYSKDSHHAQEVANFGTEAVKAGMMNWGGEIWKIESTCGKDKDLIELLQDRVRFNSQLSYQLEDPSALPVNIDLKDQDGGDWFVLRFHPELILYSREKALICTSESRSTICSDVELDSTYLKKITERSIFQSLLTSAIISRDYAEEIDEFISDYYGEDGSEMPDMGDNILAEMSKMMMGGDIELSEVNESILDDIPKGATYLLENYTANDLCLFRSNKNQSLLHYAVKNNDIDLYELSKKVSVDPTIRDTDQFSVIDVCAEKGNIKFFDLIRADFDVDINDRDWKGFSAYNRARTYRQSEMSKHMASKGADTSDPQYIL